MSELIQAEEDILVNTWYDGLASVAFTVRDRSALLEGLVRKGLMRGPLRTPSPWHDEYKFTREGRKVARRLVLARGLPLKQEVVSDKEEAA